ncbi:MAG: replication protein P [Porticoccaceae bacterium]|jgi:hypothetical protein|nr:replication protein P [Porticoccaceae bacterium]
MASKDLIQKVASEIAASSTRSPTAVGQAKPSPVSPELIDGINQIFALFQVNYHNQYYAAFGDNTKSENLAKKLWLSKLSDFGPDIILAAAEKIIADSEYLPTLHKMLNACRYAGMPSDLPNARKAYEEACNKRSPKAEQNWSHPVVYLAARDCGWHMLANEIETKALPAFTALYNKYCDRVVTGEEFTIEPPEALPETSQVLASKKHNREQLDQLKQLLG